MPSHPATDFLHALGKERATYQTFMDAEGTRGRPQILHGPHPAVTRKLTQLNQQGHGIFVMVNHGDLQGRRTENVTSIAAYFADLDGAPLPDTLPLPPTAVLESSPGRYHLYWRTTNAPLDDFEHTQKHIALLLNGDDKVHDLPRVMRLPGYNHQKADPFETRIVTLTEATYEHADIITAFAVPDAPPPPPPLPPAAQAYVDRHKKRSKSTPKQGIDGILDRIREAQPGSRNDTLFRMAAAAANDVSDGVIEREKAEAELRAAAHDIGLPDFEAERTINSAMRYAK